MKRHENFVSESCREITSNQTTVRELSPYYSQSYDGMTDKKTNNNHVLDSATQ